MNRMIAIIVAGTLVLAAGCGAQSYEKRLERTIENMYYQKRLNANLSDAPPRGKLEELQIYIRPPKNMTGPTPRFQLAAVEPEKFDLESSFSEPQKQSLHLLARVKRPQSPTNKAPEPAEITPHGDFGIEVVDLVKRVYGVELDPGRFKEDTRRDNTFRSLTFKLSEKTLNEKTVQIYLYGNKKSSHEVALIFEYPKAERNAVDPKIAFCLESFAVGERARRAFAGDVESEGAESLGEEASPSEDS